MAASVAGTKGDAAHKEQRVLFTRLAAQLFLLTGFFFPDSVSYFLNQYDPSKMPKYMYQATTVVWKAESWCIALLWFSNPRVREGIRKIPWLKSWCGLVDTDVERRSTSHSITASSYVPPLQSAFLCFRWPTLRDIHTHSFLLLHFLLLAPQSQDSVSIGSDHCRARADFCAGRGHHCQRRGDARRRQHCARTLQCNCTRKCGAGGR